MCPSFSCCCAYSSYVQAHQVAREAQSHYDELADLLETIEHILKSLDIYTQITPTPVMDEMVVKIMAELLSALGLRTKELKQLRPSR
jgi:hypothetical protein